MLQKATDLENPIFLWKWIWKVAFKSLGKVFFSHSLWKVYGKVIIVNSDSCEWKIALTFLFMNYKFLLLEKKVSISLLSSRSEI